MSEKANKNETELRQHRNGRLIGNLLFSAGLVTLGFSAGTFMAAEKISDRVVDATVVAAADDIQDGSLVFLMSGSGMVIGGAGMKHLHEQEMAQLQEPDSAQTSPK